MNSTAPASASAVHGSQAEEVAEAAVWLLSEAASFTTGATLCVDGGFLA